MGVMGQSISELPVAAAVRCGASGGGQDLWRKKLDDLFPWCSFRGGM